MRPGKDQTRPTKEAVKQADIVYKEAKNIAVDKEAKKAYKEAVEQAKKDHYEAITKSQ